MKRYFFTLPCFFFLFVFFCEGVHAFSIDQLETSRSGQLPTSRVKRMLKKGGVSSYFRRKTKTPFEYEHVVTDPLFLQKVAQDTLDYIDRFKNTHGHVLAPIPFSRSIFPARKVRDTLQFIVDTIEKDKKRGKFRICDPKFISKHFGCVRWVGDYKHAKKNNDIFARRDKVRLTHYAVFQFPGRYRKTKKYCKGLYSLPEPDEDGNMFTEPLVWMTKKGFRDALMQGTIFVKMPDKKIRAFRLHLTRNMSDYKKIKKRDRKYYFCEIKGRFLEQLLTRCIQRTGIVLAGDIYNIGIGKVVAFAYRNRKTNKPEMRIGIMADTGGAFVKTLYKMDYFAGIFTSREKLRKHMNALPLSTDAYILYKKS